MCLFTSARTVAIVFARSAGSEAMYCEGVLTFDGGFMDSSSSRTKCITERLKTSQRQGCDLAQQRTADLVRLAPRTSGLQNHERLGSRHATFSYRSCVVA